MGPNEASEIHNFFYQGLRMGIYNNTNSSTFTLWGYIWLFWFKNSRCIPMYLQKKLWSNHDYWMTIRSKTPWGDFTSLRGSRILLIPKVRFFFYLGVNFLTSFSDAVPMYCCISFFIYILIYFGILLIVYISLIHMNVI
jgi:hypothetical protein